MNLESVTSTLKYDLPENTRVVVGLSGGVDSAVTAYLLIQAGFDVTAIFLQCYPLEPGCRAEEDFRDAIEVASFLNIRLQKIELINEYREHVLNHFYKEYKSGRTPNPDVLCNSEIKFKLFIDKALDLTGADFFATGHYVRKLQKDGGVYLQRAVDDSKDQSYFLYHIPQDALEKTVFPLGDLKKEEVRNIAHEAGLPNAGRPDSTGICFVGDVTLVEFLKRELKEQQGVVLNSSDEVVGTHRGAWFYTIGQRRGFETSLTEPVYVIEKNIEGNTLTVGSYEDTFKESLIVSEVFLRNDFSLKDLEKASVRIRNLGGLHHITSISEKDSSIAITCQDKIQAPAPGQFAVFYSDEGKVLGGGILD